MSINFEVGKDSRVELYDSFVEEDLMRNVKGELETLPCTQKKIFLFGPKTIPRKTCFLHFDKPRIYNYSGIRETSMKAPDSIVVLKELVEKITGCFFNCALINHYKDGSQYISQHSDDEEQMGPDIASISFGQERTFIMKQKGKEKRKLEIPLTDGSLLLMTGKTQLHWTHGINKSKKKMKERWNITFRKDKL